MGCEAIRIYGVEGIPEILPGMVLENIIVAAMRNQRTFGEVIASADPLILVVAQKVVSKSEGCIVPLEEVVPSPRARAWAAAHHKDARIIEVVLQQARRIVRMDRGVIIAETAHGFVCANAGVDASNAPHGTVILLPPDPDRSAARLRSAFEKAFDRPVGVIVSDTFGRPWRNGLTNVALGISGLSPFIDYRGQVDSYGRELHATVLAAADELAGAAELVMGKISGVPAAVIRGFRFMPAAGKGAQLLRSPEADLFR